MPDTHSPKTQEQLALWMEANCYNFNSYSLNGNIIYEGFGIKQAAGKYQWYYTERGQKSIIKEFDNEEEVVAYAFKQITADQWAKSHCIGFTRIESDSKTLAEQLMTRGITFHQDEIPYYGPKESVYRTYVFGCDCQKVEDLKNKYYNEKP
ncbi:hypothetical protein LVD15_07645 [Fulvivirga maritima]|uniref:hypothetical protein n=1 Tax=Fulvivirga maritima TaxID=2904247 RepID=UPI001F4299DB|nr:hypothetical protein [Fulvivirga maritima]UII28290.1 hypothetical protein LVD15_07645 [Fulvivirga maritima]